MNILHLICFVRIHADAFHGSSRERAMGAVAYTGITEVTRGYITYTLYSSLICGTYSLRVYHNFYCTRVDLFINEPHSKEKSRARAYSPALRRIRGLFKGQSKVVSAHVHYPQTSSTCMCVIFLSPNRHINILLSQHHNADMYDCIYCIYKDRLRIYMMACVRLCACV